VCTSANAGFGFGVVHPGSSACGAFTETCGGSPSGAFLF
jgi:hypothetical protein